MFWEICVCVQVFVGKFCVGVSVLGNFCVRASVLFWENFVWV